MSAKFHPLLFIFKRKNLRALTALSASEYFENGKLYNNLNMKYGFPIHFIKTFIHTNLPLKRKPTSASSVYHVLRGLKELQKREIRV